MCARRRNEDPERRTSNYAKAAMGCGRSVLWSFGALALLVGAVGCGGPDAPYSDEEIASAGWAVHTVCATSATTTPGIDVSSWQGSINWSNVAQDGKVFAFIRVSHGTGTIDSYFEDNWAGAKANGIIRGPYQYWEPAQDPIEQADILIDKINAVGGLEPGDLPPVIDIESVDGATSAQTIANAKTWIERVETALQRRVIIYTGSYFWDDHQLGTSLNGQPLWGPNYTSNACPLISDAWDHWTFWQYSSTGSVSGISGNVDLDWFDGTPTELAQFIDDTNLAPPQPDAGSPVDAAEEPEVIAPEASAEAATDVESSGDTEPAPDDASDVDSAAVPDAEDAEGTTRSWAAGDEPSGCACRTTPKRKGQNAFGLVVFGLASGLIWRRRRSGRTALTAP